MSARRRIGAETLVMEIGERAAVCMGAEHRWGGRYRKYLIMNARSRNPVFWAKWIGLLMRHHWLERYDSLGKPVAAGPDQRRPQ